MSLGFYLFRMWSCPSFVLNSLLLSLLGTLLHGLQALKTEDADYAGR